MRYKHMNGVVNVEMIRSLTFAQLQTLQHVLQEMEISGCDSLSAARKIVADEVHQQKHDMRKNNLRAPASATAVPMVCPHCGGVAIVKHVDDVFLAACEKCRWSKILETA